MACNPGIEALICEFGVHSVTQVDQLLSQTTHGPCDLLHDLVIDSTHLTSILHHFIYVAPPAIAKFTIKLIVNCSELVCPLYSTSLNKHWTHKQLER